MTYISLIRRQEILSQPSSPAHEMSFQRALHIASFGGTSPLHQLFSGDISMLTLLISSSTDTKCPQFKAKGYVHTQVEGTRVILFSLPASVSLLLPHDRTSRTRLSDPEQYVLERLSETSTAHTTPSRCPRKGTTSLPTPQTSHKSPSIYLPATNHLDLRGHNA